MCVVDRRVWCVHSIVYITNSCIGFYSDTINGSLKFITFSLTHDPNIDRIRLVNKLSLQSTISVAGIFVLLCWTNILPCVHPG